MQKVIRPLRLRESRFCYCCIGVLLPFNTFEVISGALNYYNHTVLGQSPRLSAYYDRKKKSFHDQFPQKKKVRFTLMTNLHKSMSPNVRIESATVRMRAQSSARPTEIPRSVREEERERESFLLCDSSRSLESLYFTLVGWETRKRKAAYQIL